MGNSNFSGTHHLRAPRRGLLGAIVAAEIALFTKATGVFIDPLAAFRVAYVRASLSPS